MTQEQLAIGSHNFKSSQRIQTHPLYIDLGADLQPNLFPQLDVSFPNSYTYKWYAEGRRGLERVLKKLSSKDIANKEFIEEFLCDQYRRYCRPNTLRNSLMAIDTFMVFIKRLGKHGIDTITRQDLLAFIEHEQDRGLKASTVNIRYRALKGFLRFLIEREVISADILSKRIIIKVPDSLPRAIDPEDVRRLLSSVDHVRDRALILVLLRTGMRIGELLNTLVTEVNLKEQKIDIYEASKTRVGRVVYLSDDAQASLVAWFEQRDSQKPYLFYARGGHRIAYPSVRIRFVKYLHKAGLSHRSYTLHCLRHTCASELLNAGMPLECVQQILGHSSIEMTRRYARLTDKRRKEEYFKAMKVIERGEIDGHYQLDRQLQTLFETKELLAPHD